MASGDASEETMCCCSSASRTVALMACGSFNPPTYMHLRMFERARDALRQMRGWRVVEGIISPVSDAYAKPGLATATHRVHMLRRALATSDWIRVDAWESEQPQWTPTLDVLRRQRDELRRRHSTAAPHLLLLCGGDLVDSFFVAGLWASEHVTEILRDFGLVVLHRVGSDTPRAIYDSDLLFQHQRNIHLVTDWTNPNEVSSTRIRAALRRKESVRYLIDDSVIKYIAENDLYGEPSDQSPT